MQSFQFGLYLFAFVAAVVFILLFTCRTHQCIFLHGIKFSNEKSRLNVIHFLVPQLRPREKKFRLHYFLQRIFLSLLEIETSHRRFLPMFVWIPCSVRLAKGAEWQRQFKFSSQILKNKYSRSAGHWELFCSSFHLAMVLWLKRKHKQSSSWRSK